MLKISKGQIKHFKCIKPIVYHFGYQLELGEVCIIIDGGKKTESIITDSHAYLNMCPPIPYFTNESEEYIKKMFDIYHMEKEKIKSKFSIEIEYNWLVLKGQDKENEFRFIFE